MVIKGYFQLLVPYLLVTWLIFRVASLSTLLQTTSWLKKLAALVLSAFITFYPFTGLSLAEYLLSLNPNYSVGSLVLVIILLWPQIAGKSLVSDRYLRDFCLWNVVVSLFLYLSYLGFIGYDIYALGYTFSFWFLIMALITIILIWRQHTLSYICLAYIIAFNLKILPSNNFFDYITDGFLFIISLITLTYLTITRKSWEFDPVVRN